MNKLYYDPSNPASFGGKGRLQKAVGKKDVTAWLENQLAYTLHKPARKRFPTRPTLASHPFYQWQADLVDMQSYPDSGFKYILMVIDIYSRYGWSAPLKSKTGEEVTRAFRKIVKQAGRAPEKLQTDKGREFYNKTFQDFLKSRLPHKSRLHSWKDGIDRLNRKCSAISPIPRRTNGFRFSRNSWKHTTRPNIGKGLS